MRRKKRQTKRIYLFREIGELYERLPPLGELRWNKIMAHILDIHGESYTKTQVIDSLWAFYRRVSLDKEDHFSLSPNGIPGVFTKADKSSAGKAVTAARHQKTAEKDAKIISTHKEYVESDVSKHILPRITANRILALVGLSPTIKELNA